MAGTRRTMSEIMPPVDSRPYVEAGDLVTIDDDEAPKREWLVVTRAGDFAGLRDRITGRITALRTGAITVHQKGFHDESEAQDQED
jgi:hypothetical protein